MNKQIKDSYKGVFSLLLTPFHEDGSIDWHAYDEHVDAQLAASPKGLFAVCGTSEMNSLSELERLELARRAAACAGKTPVKATANVSGQMEDHLEQVRRMEDTGVDAVVLVPPPVQDYSRQQKFEYYARLAEACSVPVFIYEWPGREDHLIDTALYGDLVTRGGIAGIKDTTCTVEGICSKLSMAPESVVYQANMAFMLEALEAGAGIECIHSASSSQLVIDLYNAFQAQEQAEVQRLYAYLTFLNGMLRGIHPAGSKYLSQLQGQSLSTKCRNANHLLTAERIKGLDTFYQFTNPR